VIRKETGVECELAVGALGQFDVLVDGEVIASRAKGFLVRHLLGGGWPDPEDVVEAVQERIARAKEAPRAVGGSPTAPD
jgi:hypothetical protein